MYRPYHAVLCLVNEWISEEEIHHLSTHDTVLQRKIFLCLDNQNSAVSAWSRLYSATHPRVKEPEKLSYKHSNFASSLMSELPFSACILLSTFNSPEVQSYRILRIPGMDIEWYWFCGDDISVTTETKTQIRYLIQLFLSFFQVCKMLQWLL